MPGWPAGLYAHVNGFLHPNTFNFIKSFDPMIIIVLGGLGSMTGTLAASFTWALLLEGVLRLVLPQGFETWRYVVYPLMLLLIMLLRPKGILGDYEMPFLRQVAASLTRKKAAPAGSRQSRIRRFQEAANERTKRSAHPNNGREPILDIQELEHAVRRPAGCQQLQPCRSTQRSAWADRPERRRQNHCLQHDHRRLYPNHWRYSFKGQDDHRPGTL